MKLVLGSGSPRRKQFFDELGLTFVIETADIDETPLEGESPVALVKRLAVEKASAVAGKFAGETVRVLGADTIVVIDDEVLGKPENPEHAESMLKQLSGRTHYVIGGAALLDETGAVLHVDISTTEVDFIPFTEEQAAAYVACGESADKAGAYALQGRGVQFVKEIRGSYSNVIGLDVAMVASWLRAEGLL